jgi:hypothetical protein
LPNELPKKIAKTPMIEKTFLSMYTPEGDRRKQSDEITAEIKGKGYMHSSLSQQRRATKVQLRFDRSGVSD